MSEVLLLEDILNTRDPKDLVDSNKRTQELNKELFPEHDPNDTGILTMEQILKQQEDVNTDFKINLADRVEKTRRATTKFPDNEAIIVEPLSKYQKERAKSLGKIDFWEYTTKFMGREFKEGFDPTTFVDLWRVYSSSKQISDHNSGKIQLTTEEIKENIEVVGNYKRREEYLQARGFTWGASIQSGVTQAPVTIGEFVISGGAVTAIKKSLKKAAVEGVKTEVKSQIKKSILKRAVIGTGKLAAFSAGQTAFMPHRIAEKFMKTTLGNDIILTNKGYEFLKESQRTPYKAVMKAIGSTWIDNFSEGAGEGISIAASGISTKLFSENLRKSAAALFQKMNPNKKVSEFMTKAGFNGFIGELTEEQVGTLLKAVTGADDFGVGDDDTVMQRLSAAVPSLKDLLVQSGVIAITGQGLRVLGKVPSSRRSIKDAQEASRVATGENIAFIAELKEGVKNVVKEDGKLSDDNLTEVQVDKIADAIIEADNQGEEITDKKIQEITQKIVENDAPIFAEDYSDVELSLVEAEKAIIQGRINEVGLKESKIKRDLGKLETERTKLKNQGLSTVEIDRKIENKKNQFDKNIKTKQNQFEKKSKKLVKTINRYKEMKQKLISDGKNTDNVNKIIDEKTKALDNLILNKQKRFENMDNDISSMMTEQLSDLDAQWLALIKAGKSTKAIENKINTLIDKFNELNRDISDYAEKTSKINLEIQQLLKDKEKLIDEGKPTSSINKRIKDKRDNFNKRIKSKQKRFDKDTEDILSSIERHEDKRKKLIDSKQSTEEVDAIIKEKVTKLNELIQAKQDTFNQMDTELNKIMTEKLSNLIKEQATREREGRSTKAINAQIDAMIKKFEELNRDIGDLDAESSKATKEIEGLIKEREALKKADKPTDSIDKKIAKAQEDLSDVNQEIQSLMTEALYNLDKERLAAEKKGKSTKGIEKRIDNLLAKFEKLGLEIGEVIDGESVVSNSDKIRVTVGKMISVARNAFKQGVSMTKKEIKRVQKLMQNEVKNADIYKEQKARLLERVKNIQNQQQLEVSISKLQDDILDIQEKNRVKSAVKSIEKLLKQNRVKSPSGKPKGKLSADMQFLLGKALDASKTSKEDADAKIASNIESIQNDDLGFDALMELQIENHYLSTLSEMKNKDSQSLEKSLSELRDMVTDGKSKAVEAMEKDKDRLHGLRQTALEVVQGNKPTSRTDKPMNKMSKKIIQKLRTWGQTLEGFAGIMNILSQHDKDSESYESALSKMTDVRQVEINHDAHVRKASEKITKIFKDIFGLDTISKLNDHLRKDSIMQDLGVYLDEAGGEVRLLLSKSQARTIYMQMKDKDVKADLLDPTKGLIVDGVKINGLSEQMIEAIQTFLTKEDIKVANGILEFYGDYYHRFNARYRKDFKADLPQIPNYSPISRQVSKGEDQPSLLEERGYGRSTSPSSSKGRVKNTKKLVIKPDIEVVQAHIYEIEHYLNWSDKVKDLDAIFGDNDLKNVIDAKFGENTNKLISGFIKAFARRGDNNRSVSEASFAWMRGNFAVSVIAFKEAIAIKQIVSMFSYADSIPVTSFMSGLLDFAKNRKHALDVLSKSNLMIDRKYNFTRDLRAATNNKDFAIFAATPTWKNMLLLYTKLGDRAAIYMGGWAVYRHVLNETGSEDRAMKAFEAATDATQQSGALSQQSEWQRGSEFQKLFTMFKTSQMQYLRKEVAAIRDGIQGRMTPQEAVKKFVIYHFLLPMLFQFVSDGFEIDEEEQIRAASLGSLNGIAIAGDVLDYAIRLGINQMDGKSIRQFNSNSPFVFSLADGIKDAMRTINKEGIGMSSIVEAIAELGAGTVGPITGQPIQTLLNKGQGLGEILEGDTSTGIYRLFGWSGAVADKKREKKTRR